jgi:signal transduction histidine kinase/CHASE3 domain sensor protein/ActR/RegA family two-component response regulator
MAKARNREIKFLQSVYGKIAAAFIIGVAAIGLAGLISKVGFNEMLQTVKSMSAPNEKLKIVNSLFYKVTQLEQLQHANAIENPDKSARDFNPEVKQVLASVDSLRELCKDDPAQLVRLDSMSRILNHREKLSESYFTLRSDLDKNQALKTNVLHLANQLASIDPKDTKKVVTSTKKTTTITLVPPKNKKKKKKPASDKPSFFSRLFGSKKKVKKGTKQVREDLLVKIDTISEGRYGTFVRVERELHLRERDYHQKNAELLARELALVKTSNQLNRELLGILKTFEAEELSQVQGDYSKAAMVVNSSTTRMNIITIIFFVGAGIFAFLIVLDVSRGSKYRRALFRAKEAAEHLSQVKQRFLANMSHEIRTPLQSILGFAEQVRHQEKPKPEALEAIYYSSEHLLQIVNEVLDYSRIVSGKFTFVDQPFEIQKLTREVINSLDAQATKKGLSLKLDFSSNAAQYVSGDPFRIRQVLYNVIGNAIKFTEKGGVSLTVKCQTEGEKPVFTFTVKDSGIGIPSQDLGRIFNQFEQASGNDVQKHGGTGLGLSIVKTLVESQGGNLKVSSKVGEGSEFKIELPFKIQKVPLVDLKTETVAPKMKFTGEVLLVDDDVFILDLCATILNKNKVANTCLNSAAKVIEAELPENLKVVFMDIRMPRMNGLELCKILKAKISSEVKIYALTAQALPEEHEAIMTQGFDGILMKPFRQQELLEVLNRYATPETEISVASQYDDSFSFGALSIISGGDDENIRAYAKYVYIRNAFRS